MNSSITNYLKQIEKIVPDYTGPKRGRGQRSLLLSLTKKEREQFTFLESKIRLEKNRIAAKLNRSKKKYKLEILVEENDELKLKIKNFMKSNFNLSEEITSLKEKNLKLQDELVALREKNTKLEKRLSLDDDFDIKNTVPISPEWENIINFENCLII